jgi:hypothetical protein
VKQPTDGAMALRQWASRCLCLLVLLLPALTTAYDYTAQGPYEVVTAEYRLPAAVDDLVIPGRVIEYWAVVHQPDTPPQGTPLPLAIFLHGNHATCGTGENPRRDSNSQYTNSGTCPSGFVVVPQHRGYDYIAEVLASHGYLTVSINSNRGINAASGTSDDARLIKARGKLIMGHMALLREWQQHPERSPLPFPLPGIAWEQVGIFGHSRGGEAARAAWQFINHPSTWNTDTQRARIGVANLTIAAIIEVGATDYNGIENNFDEPTFDAPGTNWVAIVPACDGDVSHLAGVRPADRALWNDATLAGSVGVGSGFFSSTLFAWGTNHNFFSTEWQTSDSSGCLGHDPLWPSLAGAHSGDCPECRAPALFATLALFRGALGGDREALFFFDPRVTLPEDLDATVERGYSAGLKAVLDDASDPGKWNVTGAMSRQPLSGGLFSTAEPRLVNHDCRQNGGAFEWGVGGGRALLPLPQGSLDDVPSNTDMVIRLQRADSPLNDGIEESVFGVALQQYDTSVGPIVSSGDYLDTALVGPVGGPANSRNNQYGVHAILRSVSIPLADLMTRETGGGEPHLGESSSLNLVLFFGGDFGSPAGAILVGNITLVEQPVLSAATSGHMVPVGPHVSSIVRAGFVPSQSSSAKSHNDMVHDDVINDVVMNDEVAYGDLVDDEVVAATGRWTWFPPAPHVPDGHPSGCEFHVVSLSREDGFTPQDAGLVLCGGRGGLLLSDMVRLGDLGDHAEATFTLNHKQATMVRENTNGGLLRLWVERGSCQSGGQGPVGIWDLGLVSTAVPA